MKAIVVQQPWAWAIAAGHKPVENRTRPTSHRGPLAIVAGKVCDPVGRELLANLAIHPPAGEIYQTGIVAIVDLVDCVELNELRPLLPDSPLAEDPWALGPYCWLLENVRRLELPIPVRVIPGMFTLPEDVAVKLQ